jgi:opacity protein-like surface antigen
MEKMMKKTIVQQAVVSIVTIVAPVALFAMPPKPELSPQYTPTSGWDVTVGINYARFSNNDSSFAESDAFDNYHEYNINNGYHVGYNFGLGYHMPSKGSDLRLDYMHLSTSDNAHVETDDLYIVSGPVNSASGKLSYDLDKWDLSAGHNIDLTPKFSVGYFGGLNYTSLDREMTIYGTDAEFDNHSAKVGTEFRGVGPMFGMTGYCHPMDSYPMFDVFGGVSTAFPYGNLSTHKRVYENDEYDNSDIPSEKMVVPVIGAKLGVEYTVPFNNNVQLNMQLGYQSTTLLGVAKNYSGDNASNVTEQGFFFNLNPRF